ncbi:MAG: hypothetical protein C5B59_01900 [Bacteroidetes bacterium]|nr:MAG: hypothetical protein C5B59_01900 [Bacteroidota bacterium]
MNSTKIQFSREELALMTEAEWILTKNTIIRKAQEMFGLLHQDMHRMINQSSIPIEVKETNAKISRGENYQGLPFVILDYPRLFNKNDTFAIRILFWWAHYFTVTLHLKGKYKNDFLPAVMRNLPQFIENNFYVGVSDDEWIHALEEKAYMPLREIEMKDVKTKLNQQGFLKLTAKIGLIEINQVDEKILNLVQKILMALET